MPEARARFQFLELHAQFLHGAKDRLLRGARAQVERAADLVDRPSFVVPQRKRRALERTQAVERGRDTALDLGAFREPFRPRLLGRVA